MMDWLRRKCEESDDFAWGLVTVATGIVTIWAGILLFF